MRTSFSPFGSLKNLYWALNRQFKGSTNTGGLKADSRHRIKRLRGEERLTLPSNSMAKIKCPFVAFVLILLCAVTNPHFLILHTIYRFGKRKWWVWADPKCQKQTSIKAEGRTVTANSLHWAIHQHNTGSLFSCTLRCTPAGTLYSPDGKNPYYFDRVWGNWSNEGRFSKCAAVIQPRVPRFTIVPLQGVT